MKPEAWLRAAGSWHGVPYPERTLPRWALWHHTGEIIEDSEPSDCRDKECNRTWHMVDGLDPDAALAAALDAARTTGMRPMARLMLEIWLEEVKHD